LVDVGVNTNRGYETFAGANSVIKAILLQTEIATTT
jgi:hypothetical protein